MPKKITDFVLDLVKKAGINDPNIELALSASSLKDIELPDSVDTVFSSLMNQSEATEWGKSQIPLKSHFLSEYQRGFDQNLMDKAKEFGLSHEKLKELSDIKNSTERATAAMKALKDLAESGKGKGNSDEFVKQIADMQEKLKVAESETQRLVNETAAKYKERMASLALKTHLSFDWNKGIPDVAKEPSYLAALNKQAESLGAKFVFNEESGDFDILQAADPTLPIVKDGKKLLFTDLHNLALQNHKLLNEPGAGGNDPGGNSGNTKFVPRDAGTGNTEVPTLLSKAMDRYK